MKSPLPEDQGPTFDPNTHWCMRHMEPFRGPKPDGSEWLALEWTLATMGIFQVCVRRDDIIAATGQQIEMLDRVLREYAPLCCLVGDEETAKWVELAKGPREGFMAALEELKASDSK